MKKIWLFILGIVMWVVMVAAPVQAVTCPSGSVRAGKDVSDLTLCNVAEGDDDGKGLQGTVFGIINQVLGIAGLLAVIMIVYGGFLYTTSAGNSSKVSSAKTIIISSIVGLIIVMMAYAIVNFVIKGLTKKP